MAAEVGTLRIRNLKSADLDEVVRIDALHTGRKKPDSWRSVFRDFIGSRGRQLRIALGVPRRAGLAGYLFGEVRAFEFGSEPCGWVFAIGVDQKAQRSGVGRAMLAEAVARFRDMGVAQVRTMVRRDDVPVLSFFRAAGFSGGPYVQLGTETGTAS